MRFFQEVDADKQKKYHPASDGFFLEKQHDAACHMNPV